MIIRLVFGASASLAGAFGGPNQSIALTVASQKVLSSLQEHPVATDELPTFKSGMSAPTIQVGAGGKGQPAPLRPLDGKQSMSDTVGEMAERVSGVSNSGAQQSEQATTLRERGPDELQNPKKRMWEENTAAQEENQPRDEL